MSTSLLGTSINEVGTTPQISPYAKFQYDALFKVLPGRVSLPSDPTYQTSKASYSSMQEADVSPACIVKPLNASEVAEAVKALAFVYESSSHSAQFAVKGGGHTAWAGSASIEDGAVIDMTSINEVTVNSDRSVTSVGAGAKWSDVYSYLDPMNLAVAGGRAAQVGVGGLTLGGGLSFFAARRGFVCDNVINYEIVLANGNIVSVNKNTNPDLWIALRGGSNNFGIVTRFDLETFHQGPLWGGIVYYPLETVPQQLTEFYNFAQNPDYDDECALIQSFGYSGAHGSAVLNSLFHTKPQANPPTLQPFTAINPQAFHTLRVDSLSSLTEEQGAIAPVGFRQLWITTTFKNDLSVLNAVYEKYSVSISKVEKVRGIIWSLTFQPIVPAITSKSGPQGGNSLGLDPSDGPLVKALLLAFWSDASDDELVNEVGAKFIDDIETIAREKGVYHRFVYLNYANKNQKPIDGYGAASKANLQAVSKKYDPQGLFQQGLPGGFKLFT